MAKGIAPPKSTGGGGFVFEDKVCAYFLACMLAENPPLGVDLGDLERIDFQTRPDGWFLDDALLTLRRCGVTHRSALSIKSNVQYSSAGAPTEFVTVAWEQLLHAGSERFDESTDFLGLISVPLPPVLHGALQDLIGKARVSDAALLAERYATPGWANEIEKSLFDSFACPPGLASNRAAAETRTGRLLARLLAPLEFDFEASPSASESAAVNLCRGALDSRDLEEATALWEMLQALASEFRPRAGSIARASLLEKVRTRYRVRARPTYEPDLNRLSQLTRQMMTQVVNTVGGRVHVPRRSEIAKLHEALEESRCVVLLGASGIGKSAIARGWAEEVLGQGSRVLWFDGRSFDRLDYAALEADLRLDHALAEILRSVPDARAVLVLDGLDRQYDHRVFGNLASMLAMLNLGQAESAWRVVVTCQTQEWPRLQGSFARAGIQAHAWRVAECVPVTLDELTPVWDAAPRAARLRYQTHLRPLLATLKILDLVVGRLSAGGEVDTTTWVGETSVAEWFWQAEVSGPPDGAMRVRLVQLLAERQADQLRSDIPINDFEVSELAPFQALRTDRICRQTEHDRAVFEHDLYGDWTRLRLMIDHSEDLMSYLAERFSSPLWHRALRLYGLYLLEHQVDLERWRSTLQEFTTAGNDGAADLLLESVIFAANPTPLLERLREDLLRDNGRLLRRLLGRFLHFATIPNPVILALAQSEDLDETWAAAHHRVPNWLYWPPILRFLHEHRAELVDAAPHEVARIAEMWLSSAPLNWIVRREAAELGLELGERALRQWHQHGHRDDRKPHYRAALAGARELPDAVTDFARRASGRVRSEVRDDTDSVGPLPRSIRCHPRFDPNEPTPEPWQDGPIEHVDSEWREVVLDGSALKPLILARPSVAREVVLAMLIKARRRFEWADHPMEHTQLEIESIYGWHPPLYMNGPFLLFLQSDFTEGLELVARLVDFTAEQWVRRQTQNAEGEGEDGYGPELADEPLVRHIRKQRRSPGSLGLTVEDEERMLLGDERVYGWSAWLGGALPPAVTVALMALEQFLYQKIDTGQPVEEYVRAILARTRCVAFLKVLCDVGRLQPALFEGSLRPLLTVPEVYMWDIECQVHGRFHLGIGAPLNGQVFVRLAQQFHGREHRNKDLRDVALELFFNRPSIRVLLASARTEWEARRTAEPDSAFGRFLEHLCMRFNAEKWQIQEHPEHGRVLVNVGAQELQAQHAEELAAWENDQLVSLFSGRCRMLIDEDKGLPPEEIDSFWAQVERLHALAQDDRKYSRNDVSSCVCGGIAVLVRFHRGWLAERGHWRWCVGQLTEIIDRPPPVKSLDVPESVTSWTWDCLAAEAVASLWAEEPANRELRRLAAKLVLAWHYSAVEILFRRCAERRDVLGPDFLRLRRLLFEWSYVRGRLFAIRSLGHRDDADSKAIVQECHRAVENWASEQIRKFCESRIPAAVGRWNELSCVDQFHHIDEKLINELGWWPRLDFHLIRAGHVWISTPNQARDSTEREEWIHFWREALLYVSQRPGAGERYPDEDTRWVLGGVASSLPHLLPEERPDELWRAVLDLAAEDNDWAEVFVRSFHRHALASDSVPSGYERTLRAMFTYIVGKIETDGWPRRFHFRDFWAALLGLDPFTCAEWNVQHQSLVKSFEPLFERWVEESGSSGRLVGSFARFLERPAAERILFQGIIWIQRVLLTSDEEISEANSVADPLASLLAAIWARHDVHLRSNTGAFTAFRDLLRYLLDRQHPLALELQRQLGGMS